MRVHTCRRRGHLTLPIVATVLCCTGIAENALSDEEKVIAALTSIQIGCEDLDGESLWSTLRENGLPGQGVSAEQLSSTTQELHNVCIHLRSVKLPLVTTHSWTHVSEHHLDPIFANETEAEEYFGDMTGIWLLDTFIHYLASLSPGGHLAVLLFVMVVGVILLERCFLKSSLFPQGFFHSLLCSDNDARKLMVEEVDEGHTRPNGFSPVTPHKAIHSELEELFWSKVRAAVSSGSLDPRRASNEDYVGFSQREFACREADSSATVVLQRSGTCQSELTLRVSAVEDDTGFKAQSGKDFMPIEGGLVHFQPGQRDAEFEVEIRRPQQAWSPTCWFMVQVDEIVSGTAAFSGPMVTNWKEPAGSRSKPSARVMILQRDAFPFSYVDGGTESMGPFSLAYAYMRDCKRHRGGKWWKTMFGMLYVPFHYVVVLSLTTKIVIDWAVDYENAGRRTYMRIFGVSIILLISSCLLRWADVLQTQNRGRTGGIRQHHRWQILSKLLMLDHKSLCDVSGSRSFYAAIQNVDVMTMDGYWQTFVITQSVAGLIMSAIVLVTTNWQHGKTVPILFLILPLPFTYAWIVKRRPEVSEALEKRMDGEYEWVETLSVVAHNARNFYSLGHREIAQLEKRYSAENAEFVTWHQRARDAVNDSTWITRWLGIVMYCVIGVYGALLLVDCKRAGNDDFQVGNYVLLLRISKGFEMYTTKINTSLVKLQRAVVSIRRVKAILDKREDVSDIEPQTSLNASHRQLIEMRDVRYLPPNKVHGADPMELFFMKRGTSITVPLQRIVRIRAPTEGARTTFMALVSRVLEPTSGTIDIPMDACTIMLPAVPFRQNQLTVVESLCDTGAPTDISEAFARVLELNPLVKVQRLAPGEVQALALAQAMLRDPAKLVLVRPLAFVARSQRRNLQFLLRVWQQGGSERIVQWLRGDTGSRLRPQARTLIVTDEDLLMPGEAAADTPASDVILELEPITDVDPSATALAEEQRKRDAQAVFYTASRLCE
eukprot:TRINITY_DN40845_c0_g1_i1.p1 TRINITY_DN40845_c0_g1~~TRINITY_DN40845_c0_g1_i1.p1  ORF type:complete len:1001 (-),score=89.56 TRINITY_DN40845_c0_g1_i1:130-3132(-)